MRHLELLVVVLLALAAAAAETKGQEPPPTPVPRRWAVQVFGLATNGWTIRETDEVENRVTDIELKAGAGVGLRLSYDFSSRVAAYVAADLSAEHEGVYGSYGAGVLLRTIPAGSWRFHARGGGRIIGAVTSLLYADLGAGAELLIRPWMALELDLATAVPLAAGSRDTGLRTVEVSPRGGPERVSLGLNWYPAR